MKKGIKLLIVGAGMYVTGRGTDTLGTILPAACSAFKNNKISEIIVVTTNIKTASYANKCINKISKILKTKIDCSVYPLKKNNKKEYINVAKLYKPDAAIVSVPDHLHFRVTSFLIKLKIHCLVVKPLCKNIKEVKELIKLSNNKKVLGLVEFHKRFDEANLTIKNKIENKEIGSLLYSVVEYSQKKIIPTKIFKSWSNKTNVFQYLGVHYVDLIYFFTRFKPVSVKAWGQKEFLKSKKINNWDSIQVTIEWLKPNGRIFVSNHISSWVDPNNTSSMSDQKITIVGTKGKIISDQKNRGLQVVNDTKYIQDINPYFTSLTNFSNYKDPYFFGYGIDSVNEFIVNVNNIIENKVNYKNFLKNNRSFEESLISTSIIESVIKSLKTKKTQKIRF